MLVQNEAIKELAKLIIERMPVDEDGEREEGYLNYIHADYYSEVSLMGESVSIYFYEDEKGRKSSSLQICPTRGLAIASNDRANEVLEILLGELISFPELVGNGDESLIVYSSVFRREQEKRNHEMALKYDVETLDRQLFSIYELGDEDEQSVKHICYALAALCNGHSWSCGIDYPKPDSEISDQDWNRVNNIWDYPQRARDVHGIEWFKDLIKQSKHYSNIDYYINSFAETEQSNHSKH